MPPHPAIPARAPYRHADLSRLLAPRSIALIGASPRPGSFGDRVLANCASFAGPIHLVNAKYERIGDRPCFPGLRALPEAPDCAVIAVGRDKVEEVLDECAEAGVGGAVVFASGYAETGRAERAAQQARLGERARARGIRLVGPNTIGLVNYAAGAGLTFSAMPRQAALRPHAVGIVSQSGALGFALSQAAERGVSVSHVLTSGNSCDVDMADYVAYLAEDKHCRAIACLFEGMAEPARLIEAAGIAWRADKPLVIYKIATGEAGARAALSHTGSLAGSEAAWRAVFERAGVVVVDRFEALMETAAFLAKAPPPAAHGVAVVATSGGAGIIAADMAERHAIPLPQPATDTRAVLESRIPEYGSPRNPCDVTAQVLTDPASMRDCVGALLADPNFGALVQPTVYAYAASASRLALMSELGARHGKPVCNVWMNDFPGGPGARETEEDPNLALFTSMDRCFATIAAWQRRAALRAAGPREAARLSPPGAREEAVALLRAAPGLVVTERAAKQALALYGVAMTADRLVGEREEAVGAAASLGYPVALKADSPDIPHKTEAGVVRLTLRSAEEVRAAYDAIRARLDAMEPPPVVNGVLVQPMLPPGVEVMVGARVDRLFGPLVVVGLGGVLVELLADTAVAPAPVGVAEARAMLGRLKGSAALRGFRGAAAVDEAALAETVARLSEFVADQAGLIAEMDVNPLICAGARIVAVDALVVKAEPATGNLP